MLDLFLRHARLVSLLQKLRGNLSPDQELLASKERLHPILSAGSIGELQLDKVACFAGSVYSLQVLKLNVFTEKK